MAERNFTAHVEYSNGMVGYLPVTASSFHDAYALASARIPEDAFMRGVTEDEPEEEVA